METAVKGHGNFKNGKLITPEPIEKQEKKKESKLMGFYLSLYFEPYADVIDDTLSEYKISKSLYKTMRTMIEADVMSFIASIIEGQRCGDKKQRDKLFEDFLYLYMTFSHQLSNSIFKKIMTELKDADAYKKDLRSINGSYDMSTQEILEYKKKEMNRIAERMFQQIDCQIV